MAEFKEQIEKLIKLQELDVQIYDMTTELDSFPVRIEEMDTILGTKKTGMNEADEAYKLAQVEKNDKENEMKTKEELIAKHETDLYQIKNNKEYTALQNEIASVQADASLLEEEVLILMDKIEEAKDKCEEEKKIYEEEVKKVDAEKNKIKEEEVDFRAKIKDIEIFREEIIGGISPDVFDKYKRILANRGRAALSKLNGNFCGECNLQLRAQVLNDVKLRKNLVLCENCTRILYDEED